MCSITAHDKIQPTYVDDAISVSDIVISNNTKSAALESLDATLTLSLPGNTKVKHLQIYADGFYCS